MPEDEEAQLAGSSGDDVSAGTSVSGVGGQAMETEDEDSGLPPVSEAPGAGWRRLESEIDDQLVAGNDGTGQSEKPAD